MARTKIEWCDMTINPIVGCTKCSPGCDNCYAEKMATRLAGHRGALGDRYISVLDEYGKAWNGKMHFDPRCFECLPKRPSRIFVGSMGDLFHDSVRNKDLRLVWDHLWGHPHHTFMVLTKRPERMLDFVSAWGRRRHFDWCDWEKRAPIKCGDVLPIDELYGRGTCGWKCLTGKAWEEEKCGHPKHEERYDRDLGECFASCCPIAYVLSEGDPEFEEGFSEDYWMKLHSRPRKAYVENVWLGVTVCNADEKGKIDDLRATPAAKRFISFEPLLGGVGDLDLTGIHWVIVGGESGPKARPMHPDWVRSIRDQCAAAGIPFFMKQMSKKALIPADLMVRQFPEATA